VLEQLEFDFSQPKTKYGPCWVWDLVPEHSKVWTLQILPDVLIVRPYSPAGMTVSGIYVEKNPKWAKVWCHILAVHQDTYDEYPDLEPGALCVYKRHSTENVGNDTPLDSARVGEWLPIEVIHVSSIEAVVTDISVPCDF
jgi:hypothetical protein